MVKFLGLYDAWRSFLDFSPSVHRPAGGGVVTPTRQLLSEPGPRGGVGEGLLTSVKRLSCLEAHSTRRLAATLPRRIYQVVRRCRRRRRRRRRLPQELEGK